MIKSIICWLEFGLSFVLVDRVPEADSCMYQ